MIFTFLPNKLLLLFILIFDIFFVKYYSIYITSCTLSLILFKQLDFYVEKCYFKHFFITHLKNQYVQIHIQTLNSHV